MTDVPPGYTAKTAQTDVGPHLNVRGDRAKQSELSITAPSIFDAPKAPPNPRAADPLTSVVQPLQAFSSTVGSMKAAVQSAANSITEIQTAAARTAQFNANSLQSTTMMGAAHDQLLAKQKTSADLVTRNVTDIQNIAKAAKEAAQASQQTSDANIKTLDAISAHIKQLQDGMTAPHARPQAPVQPQSHQTPSAPASAPQTPAGPPPLVSGAAPLSDAEGQKRLTEAQAAFRRQGLMPEFRPATPSGPTTPIPAAPATPEAPAETPARHRIHVPRPGAHEATPTLSSPDVSGSPSAEPTPGPTAEPPAGEAVPQTYKETIKHGLRGAFHDPTIDTGLPLSLDQAAHFGGIHDIGRLAAGVGRVTALGGAESISKRLLGDPSLVALPHDSPQGYKIHRKVTDAQGRTTLKPLSAAEEAAANINPIHAKAAATLSKVGGAFSNLESGGGIMKSIGMVSPMLEKLAPPLAVAGAVMTGLHEVGKVRAEGAQYQSSLGGSTASGVGQIAQQKLFGAGQLLTGGMTGAMAAQAFQGTSAMGMQGGRRSDALSFISDNYKAMGMSVSESLGMVKSAIENGTTSFTQLGASLQQVTKEATNAGVSASMLRARFQSFFDMATQNGSISGANATAKTLTAEQTTLGHQFAGADFSGSQTQAGQQYLAAVSGMTQDQFTQAQSQDPNALPQAQSKSIQDIAQSVFRGSETELVKKANAYLSTRSPDEPIGGRDYEVLNEIITNVTGGPPPNLATEKLMQGTNLLKNVPEAQAAAGLLAMLTDKGNPTAVSNRVNGTPGTNKVDKAQQSKINKQESGNKLLGHSWTGAMSQVGHDIGGALTVAHILNWGGGSATDVKTQAQAENRSYIKKTGQANDMIDHLLSNQSGIGKDAKFRVMGKDGQYHVVDMQQGIAHYPGQFRSGNVQVISGAPKVNGQSMDGATIAQILGQKADSSQLGTVTSNFGDNLQKYEKSTGIKGNVQKNLDSQNQTNIDGGFRLQPPGKGKPGHPASGHPTPASLANPTVKQHINVGGQVKVSLVPMGDLAAFFKQVKVIAALNPQNAATAQGHMPPSPSHAGPVYR